ncbi:hypothetical protein ACSFC0_24120 [Serratia marcescens]|uniref:hypothetical protein n=1 Tax=Serratia marcescens TaxID=615 RepID=UPI003ED9D3CB
MTSFVAVPHRPEIAVKYESEQGLAVISLDECPNITDPQHDLYQEIIINADNIPDLIDALSKAYQQHAQTKKS